MWSCWVGEAELRGLGLGFVVLEIRFGIFVGRGGRGIAGGGEGSVATATLRRKLEVMELVRVSGC